MEATAKYSVERILWIQRWTEKLFSFRLTRQPGFRFIPGQFVRLGLPDGQGGLVWRPYSMVSATYDDYLEFYSIAVPDGQFTSRLARLDVGDEVAVDRSIWGHLTTDRFQDGDHLWMLATGTGLAPFLSILNDAAVWQQYARLVLVHSVRQGAELSYREWLDALPRHPLVGAWADRLHYQPVVTREAWPGALGQRIPELLANGGLETAISLPLDPAHSRLMVCGNPEMVEDTRRQLQTRGLVLAKRGQPGQVAVENSF
jgi:ferredoxin--NADP+ reductase